MSRLPVILLLQARHAHDPIRDEERRSFAEKGGIPLDNLVTHNLLNGPPLLQTVRSYDALFVGGSGNYDVSKGNLPKFRRTLDLFATLAELSHPIFASCFGFQCFVETLGGKIVYDPDNMEVGTHEVMLTDEGQNDPLLGQLPKRFMAQTGHKDRAARLPDGVQNLAYSERCPYHAFRLPGKPVWATQFHPEMNGEENKRRYQRYLDSYATLLDPEERAATMNGFHDSPATVGLIKRFITLVFG